MMFMDDSQQKVFVPAGFLFSSLLCLQLCVCVVCGNHSSFDMCQKPKRTRGSRSK